MTTTSDVDQLAGHLETMLAEGLEASGVPGAAVGVYHQGEERYVHAGVTSVDNPLPVDENTLFQIGSTTKTLTATLVMRLVEQGLLDLDVPVRTYVPELRLADPAALETLTLRHALTHTGGHDGDLFEDFGRGDEALARSCAAMDVLPQLAPVGEVWSYSNAGFMIAGRAVERVTGTTFEQACSDLVLEPLDLHDSVFLAEDAITRRVAVGHRSGSRGPRVARPWAMSRAVNPAGGLSASMRDQIRYARFHLGELAPEQGSAVLPPATVQAMQRRVVDAGGGRAAAVGLAWLLQHTPGVIAHGGETNGQSSAFVIVPEQRLAIAVATNSSSGAAVHGRIVKWVLRQVCGNPPHAPAAGAAPPELAAQVAGTFASRLEVLPVDCSGGQVRVGLRPSELGLSAFPGSPATEAAPVELYADGTLRVVEGPLSGSRGEFLRDRSGAWRWLRMFGRIHVRTDESALTSPH